MFEFGGYSAVRGVGFSEGAAQTIGQLTPAALSLGMMGAGSLLRRFGAAGQGVANAGILREPVEFFQNPAVMQQFRFRSLAPGEFTAAEIAAARSRTLFARFRLWIGRGQYGFSGLFPEARPLMADLTLALNKEVGYVELANGRRIIVVGRGREIVMDEVRGTVVNLIAHTHPSGRLVPSGSLVFDQMGDIVIWGRMRLRASYLVGPDGSAVLWQSPSGLWGTDISGTIISW